MNWDERWPWIERAEDLMPKYPAPHLPGCEGVSINKFFMLKNVEIQTKKELSWRRQYRDFPVTLGFRARTLMGEAFSMALPVGQIHYLLGLLVLDAGWRQFPPVSTPA